MTTVGIKITNMPQIKRAFRAAPRLMKANFNRAIRQSIVMIERDSRILTPVDTGRLRASHRSRFGDMYGEVGTHTNYDSFVHDGTRFMRARPYLRNAVEKANPQVQSFFNKALQDTLNEIGRRT